MSATEIQDTVRAKYPETLRNRDLFMMFREMRSVGVFNGETQRITTNCLLEGYRFMSVIVTESDGSWRGDTIRWESILRCVVSPTEHAVDYPVELLANVPEVFRSRKNPHLRSINPNCDHSIPLPSFP